MSHTPIKFGTDGWRAVIAEQFTCDNVALVTRAIACYVLENFGTERPVVIGYDLRFMAEKFAALAAQTLAEYGLNVELCETWAPTPAIAYVAKSHHTAGAMMFTASHNPAEYLGIKFIPDYAGPATPEITDAIVSHVRRFEASEEVMKASVPAGTTPGMVMSINPKAEYLTFLRTLLDTETLSTLRGKRVLYDPIFGAGQGYVDLLLQEAGIDVETMRTGRDPMYGGTMPEPKDEILETLMARVPQEGFALGLSSDGDADRFGVVDETGHFIPANDLIPMVFRHLYKNRGMRGTVVRSLATSKLLDRLAEVYGDVKVVETPVGFKWIGEVMRNEPVIIGGEESGGFSILGHIPEKDGILADLLVVEMMAKEGKPLSVIYQDTLKDAGMTFMSRALNYHLSEGDKQRAVATVKALSVGDAFAGLTITEVDHRDGVKLYFGPYHWMVVRPSGTEPLLRVYLETTNPEAMATLKTGAEALVNPQPASVG